MWSVLVLSLVASAYGAAIGENKGTELLGTYNLLFFSPKINQEISNCTVFPVTYAPVDLKGINFSCECGRTDNNLALLQERKQYFGTTTLFDIVKTTEEAAAALSDNCTCKPLNLPRVVAIKLSDNLLLEYELKDNILRYFVFGKEILSESELKSVLSNYKGLDYESGQLVCSQ